MSQTLTKLLAPSVKEEFEGRTPVVLEVDDLCVVAEGAVEVFLVEDRSEDAFARRSFLYGAAEEEPVLGLHTPTKHRVLIVPVGTARILKCGMQDSWNLLSEEPAIFEEPIQQWALKIGELLVEDDLPVLAHQLPEQGEQNIKNRGAYYTDDFCFLEVKKGKITSTALGEFTPENPWLLMTPRGWFNAEPNTEVFVHSFAESLGNKPTRLAIRDYYIRMLTILTERKARSVQEDRRRIDGRAEVDRSVLQQGWSYLTRILNPPPPELKAVEGGDPLMAVCYLVGKRLNAPISPPQRLTGNRPLDDIARASGLRVRRVQLEEEWWKLDSGPIIGWTADGHKPVAFLPARPGVYNAVDPETQQTVRVTKDNAKQYAALGAVFQMRLPAYPIGLKELFQLALRNSRADLLTILLLGAGAGTLALAVPVATKYFFDQILPMGNADHLKTLLTALFLVTVTNVCFALTNSVALIRFGGRFGALVASMTFDRLLTLPMTFYRQYTMGDLAQRTLGVTQVRELVTGGTLNKIVTSIFSLISFFLLVYYDLELALIASGLLALNLAFLMYNGFEQLRAQRKAADVSGEVNGVLFQILDALPKIELPVLKAGFFSIGPGDSQNKWRVSIVPETSR